MGVTTAYFLARDGHEVTVLERESEAAMSCSYANGGQLSYSHIQSWASETSITSLFFSLISKKSPILIQNLNKDSIRWLKQFVKNSFAKNKSENSKKLWALSSYSKSIFEELLHREQLQFDYDKCGTLYFYLNKRRFEKAIRESVNHNEIGCRAQILTIEECIQKEPTLSKIADNKTLVGGVFYPDDASGNCMKFVKALEKICREKYDVKFEYDCDVKNIFTNYERVTGINTTKGVFTADNYVYALGALGNSLLHGIKVDSMIYPIKGYSLSIKADEKEFLAPHSSMIDSENKIVYSRLGNIFRAAGCAEISGYNRKENSRMLKFLVTTIKSTFSDFGNINQSEKWLGFRPFRPNSIPLVCQVKKYGNLYLNTGHGNLGWTLSCGSSKNIANLITTGRVDKNLKFLSEEGEGI